MSSRPWMPLYWQDFKMDTLDLRAEEIGLYLILLMLAWRRDDAGLPNDMAWLKRTLKHCVSDMHGHRFNRLVPKLLNRYFTLGSDGLWRNRRLCLERQKCDKRSANGFQNISKRWAKTREVKGLLDSSPYTKALPSQSHKKERGKNGAVDNVDNSVERVAEKSDKKPTEKENQSIGVSQALEASLRAKGWI
jgi:uncharacterized protein YdaU (DUF1376 family)